VEVYLLVHPLIEFLGQFVCLKTSMVSIEPITAQSSREIS